MCMDAILPGIRQEADQLLPAEASLHSCDLTWHWPDMWAMFDMFGMVSTILRDGRYCHLIFADSHYTFTIIEVKDFC